MPRDSATVSKITLRTLYKWVQLLIVCQADFERLNFRLIEVVFLYTLEKSKN